MALCYINLGVAFSSSTIDGSRFRWSSRGPELRRWDERCDEPNNGHWTVGLSTDVVLLPVLVMSRVK